MLYPILSQKCVCFEITSISIELLLIIQRKHLIEKLEENKNKLLIIIFTQNLDKLRLIKKAPPLNEIIPI